MRAAGGDYPAADRGPYLRLPPVDPRVLHLAAQITSSATNDFDKAAAIENYLRPASATPCSCRARTVKDPIANFLFERKQGHCEYFASSMAVMLRTLGIPSRVVNGFRTDEFNDLTGNYVVRAKDAHAWVEAYFPGYGWQTFDPTPAGNGGTPQGWNRLALYVDAMASFWRDWVVSYDSSHQYFARPGRLQRHPRSVGKRAQVGARSLRRHAEVGPPQPGSRGTFARPLGDPRRGDRAHSSAAWKSRPHRAPAARKVAAALIPSGPRNRPPPCGIERMARALARRGVEKPRAQTAQEFVEKIEDNRLREPVARFTQVYESARFGNSADDAQRLPELYEEVETATARIDANGPIAAYSASRDYLAASGKLGSL